MSTAEASFYVTGGTLRHDAPSYVERQADHDLFDGLLQGEFCYVLTSRQMGKSSLMVRTAQKLRAQGINVVALDLTAIGQNLTPEQWYDGLIVSMGRQLRLEDELEAFWMRNTRLSPVQRLILAIRDVALMRRPGPLVVFVDEIDIVVSLPFSTDEFFAAIRECYNRRTEDPELGRLRFCLLGVATPTDLIRNTRLTPFNIGRRIDLADFTTDRAAPLAGWLSQNEQISTLLLQRVFFWTAGHPYLTQRLCRAIAEDGGSTSPRDVDRICVDLFLSIQARERDDNLLFVRERILNSGTDLAELLNLYAKIRKGRTVLHDETNLLVSVLNLSGITRSEDARLRVRNRIYTQVFDREWIISNLPDAERRRQRAAFKRGAIAATLAVLVCFVLLTVPVFKNTPRSRATASGQFTNIVLAVVNGRPVIPPELLGIIADNPTTEVRTKTAQSSLDLPRSPATAMSAVESNYALALTNYQKAMGLRTNGVIWAKSAAMAKETGDIHEPEKTFSEAPLNDANAPEPEYQTAMKAAQAALDRKEFAEAITQAGVALATRAKDPAATMLLIEAQGQIDLVNKARTREQKYQAAMKNAQAEFDQTDYAKAITQSGVALDTKANDPAASNLPTEAQGKMTLATAVVNTAKAPERSYQKSSNVVVLQMQGKVEFLRNGAQDWDPVRLDSTNEFVLHLGDRLRTGLGSRATLHWPDQSLIRINELTELEISAGPQKRSVIDLLKGFLYFFHRDKTDEHEIQIQTPTVSAEIKG